MMVRSLVSRRDVLAALGAATAAGLAFGRSALAQEVTSLRVASVKFGSVSWLLETMKAEGLDKAHNVSLDIVEVPTNQAGPVELLAGGADIIVCVGAVRIACVTEPRMCLASLVAYLISTSL